MASHVEERMPLLLSKLHHDVRFEIYKHIMSDPDAAPLVRTYAILDPNANAFPEPMSSLSKTNKFLRHDIDAWASCNKSWLYSSRHRLYNISDEYRETKFVLKWPHDVSSISQESLDRWHQFCYEKPYPISPRHLVIEIQKDFDSELYSEMLFWHRHFQPAFDQHRTELISTLGNIFIQAALIERAKKRGRTTRIAMPFTQHLKSVDIIFRSASRRSFVNTRLVDEAWNTVWCCFISNTSPLQDPLTRVPFFHCLKGKRCLTITGMQGNHILHSQSYDDSFNFLAPIVLSRDTIDLWPKYLLGMPVRVEYYTLLGLAFTATITLACIVALCAISKIHFSFMGVSHTYAQEHLLNCMGLDVSHDWISWQSSANIGYISGSRRQEEYVLKYESTISSSCSHPHWQ